MKHETEATTLQRNRPTEFTVGKVQPNYQILGCVAICGGIAYLAGCPAAKRERETRKGVSGQVKFLAVPLFEDLCGRQFAGFLSTS